MKVLLLNGSPHQRGCTYTALKELATTLTKDGIGAEIVWVGTTPVTGCHGCGKCKELGYCTFEDDRVNGFVEKAREADGFVFASPVHYASASGTLTSFLDRAFYSGRDAFENKPGTALVSARRAGTTAALDQINKYFTINNMPIVSGRYWNMVHGSTVSEVEADLEGMANVRQVAHNMAWLLKSIQAAKLSGVKPAKQEKYVRTDFHHEA